MLRSSALAYIACVALASPFVVSGLVKALDFAGAVAEVRAITGIGEEAAPFIAVLVIAVQLAGSVLLVSGRRWAVIGGSGLLAGFTMAATIAAHAWWLREGPERARDIAIFFEHVAMCGGLALAAVLTWRK